MVTLTSLVAYWLTRGAGPFWQDSGLFLAALKAGGGLLSPGYPVYLLLGRPFVALFDLALPAATFAEAGNFFSSVWAALAAGVTALSVATVLGPRYRFFADAGPTPGPRPQLAGRPVIPGTPALSFRGTPMGRVPRNPPASSQQLSAASSPGSRTRCGSRP